MKRYYTKADIIYGLAYLLLFLYAIRFMNKNGTFMLLYGMVALFVCLQHLSLSLSKECLVLLAFGFTYFGMKVYWGTSPNLSNLLMSGIGAPMMYMAGQNFIRFAKDRESFYARTLWIMGTGMFLFALLSLLKNGVIYTYQYGSDKRQVPDLWIGTASLWQATNINGYTVIAIILAMVCLMQKEKGKKRLLSIVLLLGSLYLTLVTAARTNLFLIIAVAAMYVFLWFIRRKNIRFVTRASARKVTAWICIAVLMAPVVVLNLERILVYLPLDAFIERTSHYQLSLAEDARWEMWMTVIQDIPSHLFGNITSVTAAHNLYLDIARESGVLPMCLLLIYTVMIVHTALRFWHNDLYARKLRVLNTILIFSMMITFMIEPVMNAMPYVFIGFCMICGMQKELTNHHRESGRRDISPEGKHVRPQKTDDPHPSSAGGREAGNGLQEMEGETADGTDQYTDAGV